MQIKCRKCGQVNHIDERIISYVRCMNCGEIVIKPKGRPSEDYADGFHRKTRSVSIPIDGVKLDE